MTYLAASIVLVFCLIGVALTLLTLPGIWVMIGVAVACQIWRPELFSLWTLATVIALGLLAELVELLASAAGTRRAGGTRAGALMSILGGVVGAIAGGIIGTPIPILGSVVGTILGAVIGAGVGAFVGERGIAARGWRVSARSAGGAAAGRLIASIAKLAFALLIASILSVAAFVG